MAWTEKHKEGAAQAAANALLMGGSTLLAIRQYADDEGLPYPNPYESGDIIIRLDEIYNGWRKEAGVQTRKGDRP